MRKLSRKKSLRHRLHLPEDVTHRMHRQIARQLARRRETSVGESIVFMSFGLVAGVAAGVALAQKYGGFGALTSRLRHKLTRDEGMRQYDGHGFDDDTDRATSTDDLFGDLSPLEQLEERVLEAYRNDPILSERAVDIGAIDEGVIELTGWVHSASESEHAVTLARGTPGVHSVLNHLTIRDEHDRMGQDGTVGDNQYANGKPHNRPYMDELPWLRDTLPSDNADDARAD